MHLPKSLQACLDRAPRPSALDPDSKRSLEEQARAEVHRLLATETGAVMLLKLRGMARTHEAVANPHHSDSANWPYRAAYSAGYVDCLKEIFEWLDRMSPSPPEA